MKINLKGRFVRMMLEVAIPLGLAYWISHLTINIWPVRIIILLFFYIIGVVIFEVWLKEKF